jgi:hypothetical protein
MLIFCNIFKAKSDFPLPKDRRPGVQARSLAFHSLSGQLAASHWLSKGPPPSSLTLPLRGPKSQVCPVQTITASGKPSPGNSYLTMRNGRKREEKKLK